MPTEPERFLGWLETEFCAKLLSGEVEMGAKDSRRSYRVGCAFLKGEAAAVAVDAPLTASAEEPGTASRWSSPSGRQKTT